MPIVHHTDARFTGREVVAGVALDFTNGSAPVAELSQSTAAIITAVKHWSITHEIETPEPPALPKRRTRKAPADDTDIHAALEPEPEDAA